MAETVLFKPAELSLINEVARNIGSVDHNEERIAATAFEEIVAAFEEVRARIIEQLGPEDFATMEIEIDLTQRQPEIHLHYTTEARNGLQRKFNRIRGKEKNTKVLILTKTGYREETPQTIDEHRFKAGQKTALREAPYSRSSFSSIYNFIGKMRARLQLPRERL